MADEATPAKTVKPGWQTTQFWLTLLSNVLPILMSTGIIHGTDGALYGGMAVAALTNAGYITNRTIAYKQ